MVPFRWQILASPRGPAFFGTFLETNVRLYSVDATGRKLVGDFKNGGREWHPKGSPEAVRVHDFVIPELGRAAPYGVYDIAADAGWVSVGIDHDTVAFAVNAIRSWWRLMGRERSRTRPA